MSFRIGSFIFTPNSLLLPLAAAFFIAVSFRSLYPRVTSTRGQAAGAALAALAGAVLGAWVYGRLGASDGPDPAHAWLDLRFGSFGGYWGALVAGTVYAAVIRRRVLECSDALVPGILVAGAIARVGCLFTGCCVGIWVHAPVLQGVQPLRPWPLYDLAALLLTLGAVGMVARRANAAGASTGLFLVVYGLLRFPLEFLRVADPVAGPLTLGHIAAAVQVICGIVLLGVIQARRRAAGSRKCESNGNVLS